MTRRVTIAGSPSKEAFAPYGTLIDRPARAGQREPYSNWLGGASTLAATFHVNRVPVATLPVRLTSLERHPHAAQAFVPLDISRYLVTVTPSLADGSPDLDELVSFEMPPTRGVIYGANVWHASASVLDREGSFAVLMWRGAEDDDVFAQIEPVELIAGRAED